MLKLPFRFPLWRQCRAAASNVVLSVASVSGSQPLALQWDLIAPLGVTLAGTQPGASATSAGKTLSCAVNRCLLYGMNTTPMSDGAAAILTLNLAPTASGTLTVPASECLCSRCERE